MGKIPFLEGNTPISSSDIVHMDKLGRLQDNTGEGLMSFSSSLSGVANYIAEEEQAKQKYELDNIKNIVSNSFYSFKQNLRNRIDYKNFIPDYQKNLSALQKLIAPELKKISGQRQEEFGKWYSLTEANMFADVNSFTRQAEVTDMVAGTKKQIDDAVSRGDYDFAQVTAKNDLLFTPSQQEEILKNIDTAKAISSARFDFDIDPVLTLNKLQERSKDKTVYINYPELDDTSRRSLIREFIQADDYRKNSKFDNFLVSLVNNSPSYSLDGLKKAHEAGKLDDREFIQYSKILDAYNQKISLEAEQKQNKKLEESKILQANHIAAFKLNLFRYDFSSDPEINYREQKELRKKIIETFSDAKIILDLEKELKKKADNDMTGADIFQTPEGKLVKNYVYKTYRDDDDDNKFTGLKYDPWGWTKEDDQKFQSQKFFEIVDFAREKLAGGESAAEVIEKIKTAVDELNDGKIMNILNRKSIAESSSTSPLEGKSGIYQGKKVVYRNGEWVYEK